MAIDAILARVAPAAINTKLTVDQRESLIDSLSQTYRDRLAVQVTADDVSDLIHEALRRLVDLGTVRDSHDLLAPPPAPLENAAAIAGDVLGLSAPNLVTRVFNQLAAEDEHRLQGRIKSLNWELFDLAVGAVNWEALSTLTKREPAEGLRTLPGSELATLRAALDKPFADRLLLWCKTKNDLVEEMNTALQMPGWDIYPTHRGPDRDAFDGCKVAGRRQSFRLEVG